MHRAAVITTIATRYAASRRVMRKLQSIDRRSLRSQLSLAIHSPSAMPIAHENTKASTSNPTLIATIST